MATSDIWLFSTDGGEFVAFNQADCNALSLSRSSHPYGRLNLQLGEERHMYEIDFASMSQTNLQTQKRSKLQCKEFVALTVPLDSKAELSHIPIPHYALDTFVPKKMVKVLELVAECRKPEAGLDAESLNSVMKLENFAKGIADIDAKKILGPKEFEDFVHKHVSPGWEDKLHFDHVLEMFGFVGCSTDMVNLVYRGLQIPTMVAQQSEGHPEVVLKSMPAPEGSIVAKVPNGQRLRVLAEHGDYVQVRWNRTEGYAKRANVVAAQVAVPDSKAAADSETRGQHLATEAIAADEWTPVEPDSSAKEAAAKALQMLMQSHMQTHCGPRVALGKKRRPKTLHAFLSHSDMLPEARTVKTYLEAKEYDVFLDRDNLIIIDMTQIRAEIAQSNILLLLLNRKTLSSPWCRKEIAAAIEYGIPIHVVINIDDYSIPGLIQFWRGKQPRIAKKLFGAGSYQAIAYSPSHKALHDSALAKIEYRIQMSP